MLVWPSDMLVSWGHRTGFPSAGIPSRALKLQGAHAGLEVRQRERGAEGLDSELNHNVGSTSRLFAMCHISQVILRRAPCRTGTLLLLTLFYTFIIYLSPPQRDIIYFYHASIPVNKKEPHVITRIPRKSILPMSAFRSVPHEDKW